MMNDNNITHSLVEPNEHNQMGILDRFVRTLKGLLEKYFVSQNKYNWIDIIDKIINNYNNRWHTTLNTSPDSVFTSESLKDKIRVQLSKKDEQAQINKNKLDVGDMVRVINQKKTFEKGQKQFSEETYTINEIVGNSFYLTNANGNKIRRTYRYHQLKKIDDVMEQPKQEITKKKIIKEYKKDIKKKKMS